MARMMGSHVIRPLGPSPRGGAIIFWLGRLGAQPAPGSALTASATVGDGRLLIEAGQERVHRTEGSVAVPPARGKAGQSRKSGNEPDHGDMPPSSVRSTARARRTKGGQSGHSVERGSARGMRGG